MFSINILNKHSHNFNLSAIEHRNSRFTTERCIAIIAMASNKSDTVLDNLLVGVVLLRKDCFKHEKDFDCNRFYDYFVNCLGMGCD